MVAFLRGDQKDGDVESGALHGFQCVTEDILDGEDRDGYIGVVGILERYDFPGGVKAAAAAIAGGDLQCMHEPKLPSGHLPVSSVAVPQGFEQRACPNRLSP
ncbi:hypothetical protein D3C85_1622510 [compost metagenome]